MVDNPLQSILFRHIPYIITLFSHFPADMTSALTQVHRQVLDDRLLPPALAFSRDLFVSKADRLVGVRLPPSHAKKKVHKRIDMWLLQMCFSTQDKLVRGVYLPAIAAAVAKMIQISPVSLVHSRCPLSLLTT